MPEDMPEIMPAALTIKFMPAFPLVPQCILDDFHASTFGIHQIIMLE
jgi:hypothetical protein